MNQVRFIVIFISFFFHVTFLLFSYALIIDIYKMFFFGLICSTIFVKTFFLFLFIFFFVDYFSMLLCFWRYFWLFVTRDIWELNSFILLLNICRRIVIIFYSKIIWWISRTFIFECHFDLPIWSSVRLL